MGTAYELFSNTPIPQEVFHFLLMLIFRARTSYVSFLLLTFIAAFTLPEKDWVDGYFIPRTETEKAILKKYAGNKMVEDYIASSRQEVDLYSNYKQHYGYVFYIGKKI